LKDDSITEFVVFKTYLTVLTLTGRYRQYTETDLVCFHFLHGGSLSGDCYGARELTLSHADFSLTHQMVVMHNQ
jgi:hypothetical protein